EFAVITAANGQEGIDLFREHPEDINLVILDLNMPRLDGEETFWELRQIKPDVKVILTSGYDEQEATSAFVGKGLAGFVAKPFLAHDLLKAIKATF
ncbi:MAG: response regulator transcription factor, partial [Gammaproteobacteria bacterium]|nr:response regulator transcription factor [Gammaproteobacteria bacterium]